MKFFERVSGDKTTVMHLKTSIRDMLCLLGGSPGMFARDWDHQAYSESQSRGDIQLDRFNESMDHLGENRLRSPPKFDQMTGMDPDQIRAQDLSVGFEQGTKIQKTGA
jgi:hypothetical protein